MNKYVISHHIQVSSTNKQFVVERISDKQKFNMTEVHSTCLNETIEFWCNCKHPNMIRIVDYFTNLDVLFIITEFCDIIDLRSFLQKLERYLPPDLIQKTLYELGSVVKVLHASSKYYAENVFVTKSNEMKLGYFSHANLSIWYQSLENLEKNEYSKASDVWSLDCVFYEVMTFTQLFPGKDPKEIAESIKHKEISINMSYNKSLKKLVCQMLLKNPENRVSIIQIMSHKEIVEYENSKFPFSRSSEINFSYLM